MEPKLFREAEQAAKRNDRTAAYQLMRQVIMENPTFVPAWIAMSKLVDDLEQKRDCLNRALMTDPNNQAALAGLEQIRIKELLSAISAFAKADPAPPNRKLGEYLIELGVITDYQLQEALAEQRARKSRGELTMLGEILVQLGLISPTTLARALISQQELQRKPAGEPFLRLGEYLTSERIITPEQLEDALAEQLRLRQAGQNVLLGEILIRKHCLTIEILENILERQRQEFFSSFGD